MNLAVLASKILLMLGLQSSQPATRPTKLPSVISLTPAAATEIRSIIQGQKLNPKTARLVVGVTKDAQGFRYLLDISEDAPKSDDELVASQGVAIRVDRHSAIFLYGTTIDFRTTPEGRGFHFTNPNAKPEK